MIITNLLPKNEAAIRQAAAVMMAAFQERFPDYVPDLDTGLAEVHKALLPGRICRIARDGQDGVVGLIGGRRGYDGQASG
jgi:hypothetical protein